MSLVHLFETSSGERVSRIAGLAVVQEWEAVWKENESLSNHCPTNLGVYANGSYRCYFTFTAGYSPTPLRILVVNHTGSSIDAVSLSKFSFAFPPGRSLGLDGGSSPIDKSVGAFFLLLSRFGSHLVSLGANHPPFLDLRELRVAREEGRVDELVSRQESVVGARYCIPPELLELSALLAAPLPVFEPVQVFRDWAASAGLPTGT